MEDVHGVLESLHKRLTVLEARQDGRRREDTDMLRDFTDPNPKLKKVVKAFLDIENEVGWFIPVRDDWNRMYYYTLSGGSYSDSTARFTVTVDKASQRYILQIDGVETYINTVDQLIQALNRRFPY